MLRVWASGPTSWAVRKRKSNERRVDKYENECDVL